MRSANRIRQRLAALGLLGLPLLTFPIIGLPEGSAAGVPSVLIYLFGMWGALIGLAAWIAEYKGK